VPRIVIVRHGQASFFGPDYDALSAVGRSQSRALGRFWAQAGITWDRVFVGPRARHSQTLEEVAAAYRELGRAWPEPASLADLDEHQGLSVVARILGEHDLHVAGTQLAGCAAGDREPIVRAYFRRYREILRQWAEGRLDVPDLESFAAFRERAARTLQRLATAQAAGQRVLVFSSGGFVCMALGTVLGIDNQRVLDLSMLLRNCALTEFLATGERVSLMSFNVLPAAVSEVGETFV